MNILSIIGREDSFIQYTDRPTVKVIIKNNDKILLINEGFLPGGGVESGESDQEAIIREIQEELGATVKDVENIGTVVQYRNLISKKYIVNGYTATLDTIGGLTNPQDEREAQFTHQWLSLKDTLSYITQSIEQIETHPIDDAATNQGVLYNLMTSLVFLRTLS